LLPVSVASATPVLNPNPRTENSDGQIRILYQSNPAGYVVDNQWYPLPPGGYNSSTAVAISADGSRIAGGVWAEESGSYLAKYGCVWNLASWNNGVPSYGSGILLPIEGYVGSGVNNMSENGKYIIGQSINKLAGYKEQACYWDESGDVSGLGVLTYSNFVFEESYSYSVSNNGVIVGTAFGSPFGYQLAFIWDETHGIRYVKDVLEQAGYDFGESILTEVFYVNPNGSYISGLGYDQSGQAFAWEATIPEPTTVLLLGLGALVLGRPYENAHNEKSRNQ
jgi:uncharacterized membrane protein